LTIAVRIHTLFAIAQVLEQPKRLYIHRLVQLHHIGFTLHVRDGFTHRTVQQR
jgi:hypothetical protein